MTDANPTHYVRNQLGSIHSVDHDHFVNVLHTVSRSGRTILNPDFEEVDEATARAENPQLFGAPDMDVLLGMTPDEMRVHKERTSFIRSVQDEIDATRASATNTSGKK